MAGRDERLLAVLAKVAPGTSLREGIERIMRAGKGAIIVLGAPDAVRAIVSGGFKMNAKFTSQRLSEVAKMDGAIVVDEYVEKIMWANVHLVPDPEVPTSETGTRHRTAERTARQTGRPVISVSESMRLVTLYLEDSKHVMEDISSVLYRANQALSTLERYRNRLDEVSSSLSALEVENVATVRDFLNVLQRVEMVRRIADEIESYIAELGTDGRLLQLQLDELMWGVESERGLVIRDYIPDRRRKVATISDALDEVPSQALLNLETIAEVVGYDPDGLEVAVSPRGYRLLSRIPRLPDSIVQKLVARFGGLQPMLDATLEQLDEVEGVGEARARSIREGLTRLAESSMLERYS